MAMLEREEIRSLVSDSAGLPSAADYACTGLQPEIRLQEELFLGCDQFRVLLVYCDLTGALPAPGCTGGSGTRAPLRCRLAIRSESRHPPG